MWAFLSVCLVFENKQLQRIEIDVENYKAYDFHKWKELIEIGEKEFDLKFKE